MSYLLTTASVLGWFLVLSLIASLLGYWLAYRRAQAGRLNKAAVSSNFPAGVTLPAIILAPVLLICGYELFSADLTLASEFDQRSRYNILLVVFPALCLLLCSGFLSRLLANITTEIRFWSTMPFVKNGLARGLTVNSQIRTVVILRSLQRSWALSLPWVFGELLLIEAMFNAPGLGYQLWEQGKNRQVEQAAVYLGLLAAVFIVFYGGCRMLEAWVGKRLENFC